MTDTQHEPSDEDLDALTEALGEQRDPDRLGEHLDRNFSMAGRRRVSLVAFVAVLAAGLLAVAAAAVRNDTGLEFGTDDADFTTTESEGFTTTDVPGASNAPDLSTADSTSLDQLIAVVDGEGPRIDRVVDQPEPALFAVAPASVHATVMTFRSAPAVALVGPASWYQGVCIQVTPIDATGEPGAPLWVATQVGACQARVSGTGVVPDCVGLESLVLRLPTEPSVAPDDDGLAGAVIVDVFTPTPGYEDLLVSGRITVTQPIATWPAGVADDGTTLSLVGAPGSAAAGVDCLVG